MLRLRSFLFKKVKEILNSECAHAKWQEEKDKAVDMNIKPYSWNEFPNMSKENPSEPSPPQPLDMYNHVY
ncbi:hypothetical protein P3L10_021352 [Capsicum annuum]